MPYILGGIRFNARAGAENFDRHAMQEAIRYAHLRGVQVHVAMNTLLRDEELQPALNAAADMYGDGADAIILQDWGLASLLREMIPDWELYLSTQGTIYNLGGLQAAAEMGFSRVIPARELSLREICQLTGAGLCEIEVFVHGALCICYSGQCQLSRAIGGRSGNRGECAQPCRLPYRTAEGEKGYWLSPKDLCLLDDIPELVRSGVASLKIEGRMKSPEYVAVVTGIYRKYLDRCLNGDPWKVEPDDRERLQQIFSRGRFTRGYLDGNPGDAFLSGEMPKHTGIRVGSVLKPVGRCLIDVETERKLYKGDGIEVHHRPMTGNVITWVEDLDHGRQRIGDIRGRTSPGDPVYRTTDHQLMKDARATWKHGGSRTIPVWMTMCLQRDQFPVLTVQSGEMCCTVQGQRMPEPAKIKEINASTIEKQLGKTGGTTFRASEIRIHIDPGLFLPAAEINGLRRRALDQLGKKLTGRRPAVRLPLIHLPALSAPEPVPDDMVRFPAVTKGNADAYIASHLDELPDHIVLNNPGWIQPMCAAGKHVYAGKGMNICNEAARRAIEKLGAVCVEYASELEESPDVLMVTEHPIHTTALVDRRGEEYTVQVNSFGDKYMIKRGERARKKRGKKGGKKY